MFSFGRPNKVLSLSQWNTASTGHGGGSINTTARIKVTRLALRIRLGGVMQIFAHLDVDIGGVFKWGILGGHGRVLTFIKNVFGFEILIFASLQITKHKQLVTLKRQRKTWNRITWPLLKHNNPPSSPHYYSNRCQWKSWDCGSSSAS